MPSASSSGVSAVSRTTKPPPGSTPVAVSAPVSAATVSRANSPSTSASPPAVTVPSSATLPVAGLRALDRELDVLAEPRSGRAGVDGEPLLDAVRVRLVGRRSSRRTLLTLSSSATIEVKRRSRSGSATTTVSDASGSRLRRLAALRSAEPAEQTSRTGPSPRRGSASAGRSSTERPVGQVHRAPAGEAAPDLLGDERHQRCGDAADRLEHRVEGVEGLGRVAVPEALARAADVPVGQHVEEAARRVARRRRPRSCRAGRSSRRRSRAAWPGCSGPSGGCCRCARAS